MNVNLDLDRECQPPAVLERLLEIHLRRLMLIPVSRAGSIAGDGSARPKPDGGPPKPEADETKRFLRQWKSCRTNRERLSVIESVQKRADELKFAPDRSRMRGSLDWKIRIAVDDRPSHIVGIVYGISGSYVRKLRKAKKDGKLRQVK